MRTWLVMIVLAGWTSVASADVDCSEAYGGKPMRCERVTCEAKFQSFVGVWKGPFQAYVKELSKDGKVVFRPYDNTTTYTAAECLKQSGSGESFIIGRMTNVYPAFSGLPAHTDHSLLITGANADGSPFLRTVDERKQVTTFRLDYKNGPASLAIWTLVVPGHDHAPEMEYTTIDGRDLTATGVDRRNVTLTLRVGPKPTPFFEGVIGSGFHVRQP